MDLTVVIDDGDANPRPELFSACPQHGVWADDLGSVAARIQSSNEAVIDLAIAVSSKVDLHRIAPPTQANFVYTDPHPSDAEVVVENVPRIDSGNKLAESRDPLADLRLGIRVKRVV
jgi:hypothetical protein